MSLYDNLGPRILSRPVKCYWAGWETDTFRLQQHGWRLSAEEDVYSNSMRLALDHPHLGIRGITERIEHDYHRDLGGYHEGRPLGLQLKAMGHSIFIHEHGPMNFHAIDAVPQMRHEQVTRLEDLAHFAPAPLVRSQAIVLPEPDVAELLDRILEKQAQAKTDYFKDIVAKEGSLLVPHKFHAQIISLDEARKAA